jgi:secreted trypsin-like serine protease
MDTIWSLLISVSSVECGVKVVTNRILGGAEADDGEYPWAVSLRFGREGELVFLLVV